MAESTQEPKKTSPSWKEAYESVRQPIRDVQNAHSVATVTGSATVEVDGQKYKVTRDSAGRSMTPVEPPAKEEPQG